MQFDTFYQTLGTFGRYQKWKYFFICLTYMLPPIMVYTWTFTAAMPSFHCQLSNDDIFEYHHSKRNLSFLIPSESQCRKYKNEISLVECQRCYRSVNKNRSFDERHEPLEECRKFVFDRTYFQSTLVEEWSMICNRVSLKSFVQTVFFFGYMIGSLIFGILSDQFGRRPIMVVSFMIVTVASFLCVMAPQQQLGVDISYSLFTFGRFLLACAGRGIALSGFVIGIELVGPKQRLFTGIVIEYFFAIGELILLGFAYVFRTWRLLQIALAILSIPFLFFYCILPESPRWLISKGRFDEAERLFRQIAKINGKNFDSIAYQRLVAEEKNKENVCDVKKHGLLDLFRSKILFIIMINMSFQWFVQNLVFYGVSQNTNAWLVNPYISFAASAIVEIVAYFVTHLVLHRWGRKSTYCSFVIGFSVFAFLVIPIQMLMIKNSQEQYCLMFIVNVMLKFFASGSYAIIYIYANELFPTSLRNTGIGICSMIARIGAIVGTLFNDVLTRVWSQFPIVIFGIISIIAVAFITICPETFNKVLPQTVDDVELTGLVFLSGKSRRLSRSQIDRSTDLDEQICLKQ